MTGFGKWLAREARAENLMRRHRFLALSDVSKNKRRCLRKVALVEVAQLLAYFAGENTFVS
jgi:hypothetical protein